MHYRKGFIFCLVVLFLSHLFSPVPSEAQSEILFGCDRDYPPLSSFNGSSPVGFDIEIINIIAEAGSFQFEIITDRWSAILDKLSRGDIDVVSGVIRTEKREELYDFSVPYLTESYAVYTKPDLNLSSVSQLIGKKIAVLGDDAIIETYVIPQGLDDDMILTSSFYIAFQLVADGDADYTIAPYTMGQNAAEVLNIKPFTPDGRSLLKVDYRFAVKKGRSDLLFILNETLTSLKAVGVIDEIHSETPFNRQFSKSATAERASGFHLLLLAAAVLFCGMIVHFVFRNRMQKKISRLENRTAFLQLVLDNIPICLSWRSLVGESRGRSRMCEADDGRSAVELMETAVLDSGKAVIEYDQSRENAEIKLTSLPLFGEGEKLVGLLSIREDFSEQKMLRESVRNMSFDMAVKTAELEQLRITDPLTGLFNRKYLAEKLQEELSFCEAHEQKFSVILIDIKNQLKTDSGHEKKPEYDILQKTTGFIRKILRHSDIAGFIGSSMFLIIMPKTSLTEAESVTAKLSEYISAELDDSFINCSSFEFPTGGHEPLHSEVWDLLNIKQDT